MYKVLLRNNETGEERLIEMDDDLDPETGLFAWEEGNMSCDCNRHTYFELAAGKTAEKIECSETKYTAFYAELPDGNRHEIDSPSRIGGSRKREDE